jgi:hypothetical protein
MSMAPRGRRVHIWWWWPRIPWNCSEINYGITTWRLISQDLSHGIGSSQERQWCNYRNKISNSRADPSQQAGREDAWFERLSMNRDKQEQLTTNTILDEFCSCDDLE